jgi:site-specific DNA recombinase
MGQIQRQQERLLDAYVGGVLELAEFQRKRQEISHRQQSLHTQERHLTTAAQQHLKTAAAARGIEEFCTQVRQGLASATFEQRRVLVELLVDRVIVTDEDVEIRYVIPTSPNPSHQPFCQLRSDYLDRLPRRELLGQEAPGNPSPKNVEDAVHHLPNVDGTGTASWLGRR